MLLDMVRFWHWHLMLVGGCRALNFLILLLGLILLLWVSIGLIIGASLSIPTSVSLSTSIWSARSPPLVIIKFIFLSFVSSFALVAWLSRIIASLLVLLDGFNALALSEIILVVKVLDYPDAVFVASISSHFRLWARIHKLLFSGLLSPGRFSLVLFFSMIFHRFSVLVS